MRWQCMNSALCLLKQWNVCIKKKKKKKRKHVDVKRADADAESKHMQRVCLDIAYFVKNWKHCSKTNFKCVNSVVGPIFNEKVVEKWDLWVLWTVYETHWCALFTAYSLVKCLSLSREQWQPTFSHASQLKKEGKRKMPDAGLFHPYPNVFKVFRIEIRCKTT